MHEVIYFEAPGYAEPTRLCLELSGKPWKNTIVDWDGYQKLKEAGRFYTEESLHNNSVESLFNVVRHRVSLFLVDDGGDDLQGVTLLSIS